MLALMVSNVLLGTVAFTIAGCLAPPRRWRHLCFVALVAWLTSLINVACFGVSIAQWIGGAIFIAIIMAIGGGISYVFKRDTNPSENDSGFSRRILMKMPLARRTERLALRKSTRTKIAVAVLAAVLLTAALGTAPLAFQLYRINDIRERYRLDDAVNSEVIADEVHKPTADYVLDPPFMQRYGLSFKDYLDDKGCFSPKGAHWVKWSLETKTAAVLMWRQRTDLSAWEIRHTIRLVDDYYSRNDRAIPVVKVVDATKRL
jgi:hypothetical protein